MTVKSTFESFKRSSGIRSFVAAAQSAGADHRLKLKAMVKPDKGLLERIVAELTTPT
jgi:hypothetical protein